VNLTSRPLKNPQAAQSCVKNQLKILMYWHVHCGFSRRWPFWPGTTSPILALSCTRLRLFQQPARWIRTGLLLALVAVGSVHADDSVPAWNQLTGDQQRVLQRFSEDWDALPAERRQRMATGANRWLKMTPEQRQQARGRLGKWQQLSPDQRRRTRQQFNRYRQMSPEDQARVQKNFRRFRDLPPERREKLRRRWENMTPEQRDSARERMQQRKHRPPEADQPRGSDRGQD